MPASGLLVLCRVILAIGGGYALTAGLASLAAVALLIALPRSEAVVLASMLAFLIYLAVLLWAAVERRLSRLCLVLVVGSAALWSAVLALARLAVGT